LTAYWPVNNLEYDNRRPFLRNLVLIELFSLAVTAESLRAKRDRKSAISLQHGQFDPKFQVEGVAPHQLFLHGQLGQWTPYNSAADSFHTKKLCSRLSSSEVRF